MNNGRTTKAKLEIGTPAVSNPGITVELEPGGVSDGGREIRKSNCYVKVVAVLLHCVW